MLRKASAKGELPASAKLTSQKERGAQNLAISTVDGWLIGEEQDFVIFETDSNNDIVPGSATSWKGVPASNGSIAGLTLTGGLDRLYPIGAAVVPTATSAWANDLVEWLLKSHNPDGTLKESAIPELKPQVIPDKSITADKIDFTTMPLAEKVKVKRNNTTTDKSVNMQCGVAMISVPTPAQVVESTVTITFPTQFKSGTIPVVVCTFNGYNSYSDGWTDTPLSDWGACVIGAVSVTNNSFIARARRVDGGKLWGNYYFNWIAIGQA